ncbi:hypothetical protein QYE76_030163 [Lolium multiflorum]|uniref:Uncharacterized protein n=1 Tax=Lolium multiflorum TaxID=4521 RepID=A0AAD8QQA5_LOLMU|nr:hypothetical protein QYE76_030163 [Lolium multiflorum]
MEPAAVALKDARGSPAAWPPLEPLGCTMGRRHRPRITLMRKPDKFVRHQPSGQVLSWWWSAKKPNTESSWSSAQPLPGQVLSQSKQNDPHYQKVTYGVYMAAKKLKHYFQEHPIRVVATAEIIGSKDANGRVAKWAPLELAAHTILYEPRTCTHRPILAGLLCRLAEM